MKYFLIYFKKGNDRLTIPVTSTSASRAISKASEIAGKPWSYSDHESTIRPYGSMEEDDYFIA